MCGIAGFILNRLESDISATDTVQLMSNSMSKRGPDASGIWSDKGIAMGHRRLSILDLDARANQPMISHCGRYIIVYNGEIYNFLELRQDLERSGIAFRTTSDTEVLLSLYAREGKQMLSRLRGMFAFAIWDSQSCELFLARDPYGIKPLYYVQTNGGFLFASQVKALLASGQVSTECEAAGLVGFYLWGSVPEPWTLYRNVFALPAGHLMYLRKGQIEAPACWYDIRKHWRGAGDSVSRQELKEIVSLAVKDSVQSHLVSDVPVSVFLSGGIDSSAVAGLAASVGAQVEGITLGFKEFNGRHENEVPDAASVAACYGLLHTIRFVSKKEFVQDIPHILNAMDQPSIDGVNTWFASKAAAERGYKVVLSGVGGDELFCGYGSFRRIPRIAALGSLAAKFPGIRFVTGAAGSWLAKHYSNPKIDGLKDFMDSLEGLYFLNRCLFLPQELPSLMDADLAVEGLFRLNGTPPGMISANARSGISAIGLLESTHYLRNQLLRDSDWASMGHSLELRTPLVDASLLASLGPYIDEFIGGVGKKLLARSPEKPLPSSIIDRPKTGFSLPMQQWLPSAFDNPDFNDIGRPLEPSMPWARKWARFVIKRKLECA